MFMRMGKHNPFFFFALGPDLLDKSFEDWHTDSHQELGHRQVVSQWILIPSFPGSNPGAPAILKKPRFMQKRGFFVFPNREEQTRAALLSRYGAAFVYHEKAEDPVLRQGTGCAMPPIVRRGRLPSGKSKLVEDMMTISIENRRMGTHTERMAALKQGENFVFNHEKIRCRSHGVSQ
jgi:hypothetical protein